MRVLMCLFTLSLVACGSPSREAAEVLQSKDDSSPVEVGQDVPAADSGVQATDEVSLDTSDTNLSLDTGETGTETSESDVAGEADVFSADTSSVDTGPDVSSLDTVSPDTAAAAETDAVDSEASPVDTGVSDTGSAADTAVADTYVSPSPADTAPVCKFASGMRVTTGDSAAVMLNGTYMCYEMRIRRSSLPTTTEWVYETSNSDHLKVGVTNTGSVFMRASGTFVFGAINITPNMWHDISACKVPDLARTHYHLQITVDGNVGDLSSSRVPLTVVIPPGTLSIGWSGDYDQARVVKRDGTILASWPMDGSGDDVGPNNLNATGSPSYTTTGCP